ncbi:MAG: LruC domain-containing protein [Deltaproteobacteria bacterium]|nr:LruC domain-containing protein [Deltaproteobacteria bacterium]
MRCIHFATNNDSYTGVHSAEYDVRLNAPQVSSLNSRPGAYEFVDNTVTASGPWGTVNDAPGSSASYTLTSTFWNSRRPDGDLGTYWQEQLGVPFYILGEAPFALGYDYVDAFSGFDNLTFGATLPLEVDIVDGPTTHYSTTFLDDAGNTVTPTCSWGAQVRNGGTVTPAWYQCHVNGHVPSITPGRDPFSVCAPPFFCTDGYYGDQGPDGNPLWNEYRFYFQTKLVSGTQGQQIAIPMDIWADTGNVSPPDIAPTGGSASNPIHAVTYVTVTGEQQLRVSTSAAQTQVLVGGTATFNIGFQNTGSVTSQNTYVYDIFGYDPVTAQALGATYPSYGCTTQPTPFLGVSQVQGAPAVDIEYTTDASANVGSTWLPYTNTVDNSTVTGLRFRINSAYSSTAGQYSPSDLAGLVNVNFQAPDDLGSRICTMAAIQADGFLIAGALDSQTPIHIVSVIIDPPHSDIQANATYGTFCGASVALDGTASTSAVSYAWFDGSTPIGTDPSFSITLAPGTHDISLTTTNELGQTDTAHKTVTVTDGNAPTITCPDGPIYASIDAQCNPSTTITATAADDCDGSLTPTCTALQAGDGSVTCSVTDSAGNTATCSVETHVTGGNTAPSFAIDSFLTSPNGGICENSYFQVSGTYSPGCGSSAGVQVTASYFDAQGGEHQFYSWYGQPYLYDNGDGTFQVYDYFSTTDVDGNTPPSGATIKITLTNSDGSTIVNTYANTTVETCGCIEVFSPGLGAVMFEDLHPSNGDFDFNDQVVTYEYTAEEDGNTGKIMRMKAMFNDLAIGATIHSSLNLGIPGLSPDHISRIDRYFSDGTQDTLQPVVGEQSSAVIPVLDDTFQLYSSGSYINTDPNQAQQSGRGVAIVITFTDDTYYWDVFSNEAPLDLFIARTGNYGRQIHLPAYGPTDMGTEDLRNTADDASNTNGWGNYTNTDGVPFAISIPDFPQYWATERTDVASVFTELVPWVQSGGSDYNNYYWYGEAIDTSHAIPAPLPISSDSVGPVFQSFTNFCGD